LEADFHIADAEVAAIEAQWRPAGRTIPLRAATARLAAAELAYGLLSTQFEQAHRTPTAPDRIIRNFPPLSSLYEWSNRALMAGMALAPGNVERLAAAEGYRERVTQLEKIVQEEFKAGQTSNQAVLSATFYCADAHYGIAQLHLNALSVLGASTAGWMSLPLGQGPLLAASGWLHGTIALKLGDSKIEKSHKKVARARTEAAKAVYESLWDVPPNQLPFPEAVYEWSCQWRDATMAATTVRADKIAAAEAHLSRVRQLQKAVKEKLERMPTYLFWATEFYIAEAEILLSEAKSASARTSRSWPWLAPLPGGGMTAPAQRAWQSRCRVPARA
jgi:hypothetical protein